MVNNLSPVDSITDTYQNIASLVLHMWSVNITFELCIRTDGTYFARYVDGGCTATPCRSQATSCPVHTARWTFALITRVVYVWISLAHCNVTIYVIVTLVLIEGFKIISLEILLLTPWLLNE